MNNMTWGQVLRWEQLHRGECGSPTLLRFHGRPDDLSPRARLRHLLGGPLPFDRHDWFVERCGKEARWEGSRASDAVHRRAPPLLTHPSAIPFRPSASRPGALRS